MQSRKKELVLFMIFIAIFILMAVLSPRFLSTYNLQTMAFQLPEFGLIALGMMIAILTGGINLSITSGAALSGIAAAFMLSANQGTEAGIWLIITAAVGVIMLVSVVLGTLNGTIIAYVGAAPMLVTLGSKILYEGISLWLTKGGAVSNFPEAYYWFGNASIGPIPVPMVIFATVAVFTYFLLERTPWGTRVYMVGSNPTAAVFSGINVKRILLQVYIYSSVLAGLAAVIMLSRYNSAKVDLGSSYLLQSVAAVVLGGTSMAGGHGTVLGTVIAVAILQVVSSGLNILGVHRFIIEVIMGAILIAVLTVNIISARREAARRSDVLPQSRRDGAGRSAAS
ncbi:MAG: ABC transporter permease [Firmicutes bacterium]|jgi:ribose/xylose/arabinose/galactoside ABC-type transport system permease subunit|nr:ABC transporter permease [Bacillota bacterium]